MPSPFDRLLGQYSAPVRSWPGEEWMDEEARANYEAANPPKLQTEGGAIDRGDVLPIVRYPVEKKPPAEWRSSSDVMRELDNGWRFEPFSRLAAPFKSMAQAFRDQPWLGPMVRPSQMHPEALNEMAGDAMSVAGVAATGGIGRAAVAPKLPAGTAEFGIFGGRKAKTADLEALSRAEDMLRLGRPREEIWSETGWFQGPDQKWRFEIDDSGAKPVDPFSEPELLARHQRADPNTSGNISPRALHLDDILPHEDLYKAYGHSDVPGVSFGTGRARGVYDPAQDHIHLNNGYVLEPDFGRSTLLHELQHAVQAREGTATGGNPRQFEYTSVPGSAIDVSAIDDIIRGVGFKRPDSSVDARSYLNALYDQAFRQQEPGFRPDDMLRIAKEMQRIDTLRLSPDQQYRRLAGEVEARAVQARRDLTPEERRARPPWLDYDVPESNQIVRFRSGEGAMSSVPRSVRVEPLDAFPEQWSAGTAYGRADEVASALRRAVPSYPFEVVRSGSSAGNSAYIRTPLGDIRISDHGAHPRPGEIWSGDSSQMSPRQFVDLVSSRMDDTVARLLAEKPPTRQEWMSSRDWQEAKQRYRDSRPNWMSPEEWAAVRASSSPNIMASIDPLGEALSPSRSIDRLGYYSPTLEAALRLAQKKGTPEQMLAQLKKAGAKDAEIEVSGLKKMFEGKKSVSQEEIVKALEEGKVGLEEKVYAQAADYLDDVALDMFGNTYDSITAAQQRKVAEAAGVDPNKSYGDVHYADYSLDPENPTYREVVLHLPERQSFEDFVKAKGQRLTPENERILRSAYNMDQGAGDFRSGHFGEPNIIGHMMVSETRLPLDVSYPSARLEEIGQRIMQSVGAKNVKDLGSGAMDVAIKRGAVTPDEASAWSFHHFGNRLGHDPRPRVLTLDQVQSDWGQKLRDGGVRDEAKIAELKAALAQADTANKQAHAALRQAAKGDDDQAFDTANAAHKQTLATKQLLEAELRTAEAATPGHPLVNTTDLWLNTTLRRAIRMAAEEGQDYIAIPSGYTVLSYNQGQESGMLAFYGGIPEGAAESALRALKAAAKGAPDKPLIDTVVPGVIEYLVREGIVDRKKIDSISAARALKNAEARFQGIVPKNLGALLQKLDKATPPPQIIQTLDSPSGEVGLGQGFTLFRVTPEAKKAVLEGGQPLFRWGGRVK